MKRFMKFHEFSHHPFFDKLTYNTQRVVSGLTNVDKRYQLLETTL